MKSELLVSAKGWPSHQEGRDGQRMYFIAVVLPEELNEKILRYKKLMFDKYECKVGLKSPAHITIVAPFWLEDETEKQLITDVDFVSKNINSFPIATNNFSAFQPRTIFIAVAPNENLVDLKSKTDEQFAGNPNYKIKKENRPFHPHITIATRDLHKKDFFEAWTYFEHKTFLEKWTANGLSLLRHNKKNWDVIYTSQFKN